jgi:hypothetical protein
LVNLPICHDTVATTLKKFLFAASVSTPPNGITATSFRPTGATVALDNGATFEQVLRHGRSSHQSLRLVQEVYACFDGFQDHVARIFTNIVIARSNVITGMTMMMMLSLFLLRYHLHKRTLRYKIVPF